MTSRGSIRKEIIEHIDQRVETDDGYKFILDNSDRIDHLIDRFVRREEQCCTFLSFTKISTPTNLELIVQTQRTDRIDGDKDFITNGLLSEDFLD